MNTKKSLYLFLIIFYLTFSLAQAIAGTSYFSDDFENGLIYWDTGGDTWQITDLYFRSGNHSVSESPQGNYEPNANSIMAMKVQYRVNLSTSDRPVLTFWHRIGVYNGDYGRVEVSQDNGFNWEIVMSFTNTWRSTWSREQVDLSAYKSSPILIRFCLRDNGDQWPSSTVSTGWDIDDVEIHEADLVTLQFPFFDDMESGTDNWDFGSWQLTQSYSRSSTHCMTDSNNVDYSPNACSDLILAHPIDLSTSEFPVLSFWHQIGVHNGDSGRVEVSQDGGLSWHYIDPNDANCAFWTNTWYSSWTPEIFDLSAYKFSSILIRFRLRDNGDQWPRSTISTGWDIDDVEIRELIYHPDPLMVQITQIETSDCPEIQATVIVTDMNNEAVTDLNASNISVYENGIIQEPITVKLSTSSVNACLALDYSGSMESAAIEALEIAATGFIELMLPGDNYEIIKFAKGIEVMQGYTGDKNALLNAIRRDTTLDRGATSLYDAIYEAISDTSRQTGNKAVIVMSDGTDTNSQQSATGVIDHAVSNSVPVFTIGLGDEIDENVLIAIATQTGGIYYHAPTPEDLAAIYEKIAGTLNTQYLVTYNTTICGQDSNNDVEHELNIEVSKGSAYGQDSNRFRCPSQCDQNTVFEYKYERN